MSYGPEDFAEHHYKKFPRRAPVSAALLKRPNQGVTIEELNRDLGLGTEKTAIEGTRKVLREMKETIEIISRKNPRGPPTKIYKPGALLEAYRHPILSTVFGKGREEFLDLGIGVAIRCNKPPMECPDSSCKICAANGEKTRWDLEKE